MFICDIKTGSANLNLVVLCARLKKGVTKTGSSYLWLTLRDKTKDIDARLWDVKPEDEVRWKKGRIYQVQAQATEYNGSIQLRIDRFKQLETNMELAERVFPKADININTTFKELMSVVKGLKNKNYRQILLALLKQHGTQFKQWPAAISFHHAVLGGLLWHTFSMLKSAQALRPIYQHLVLDWELLYAGIILHDFGKIIEIDRTELRLTTSGLLIGHISIMQAAIKVLADQLKIGDHQDVILLQHMVIASHGKMEFGTPVPPRLIEAELLSLLDNLDAKLYMVNHALLDTPVGETTPPLKPLEFRSFLHHYSTKG